MLGASALQASIESEVPVLREAVLEVSSLTIRSGYEDRFFPPFLSVDLECSYLDQLGGPVLYQMNPGTVSCTDSTGKTMKIETISSQPTDWYLTEHGGDINLSLRMSPPSPETEWVHLQGFFVCAFADDFETLPVVQMLVRDKASVDIALGKDGKEKVTLLLEDKSEYWSLRVTSKLDFHLKSIQVVDSDGIIVKKNLSGKGRGRSSEDKSIHMGFDIEDEREFVFVKLSHWNKLTFRKIPVDMKLSLGGIILPQHQ